MVWRMKRRVREKKWMRGWRRRICSWWEGAKEEDRERSWLASSSPKPERGHQRHYQQHHQHQFQHHDCQSWFTWKSNLSRVLAKRIRRLAEESSPVGRTTCIFHEWFLKMVLRWKKWGWWWLWWMVVMVIVICSDGGDGGGLVGMCNYLWPTWTSDAHNTHPSLLGIRTFINRCRFCIFSGFWHQLD